MPLSGHVWGRYSDPTGDAMRGAVRFRRVEPAHLPDAEPPATIAPRLVTATLDATGLAEADLAIGTYEVSFALVGASLPRFRLDVTADNTVENPGAIIPS
ncbi:hypothetical protein [Microbacterium sp. LWS13-1.2]|uniref:Uncharacterized protein n=1 Tax=Microbacterium sp. LWS13-1.2 TaxID=3135264 RepID=A0AAU6SGV4_9MICO